MLVKLSASPFKAGLIFQKDANKKLNNFVKRKDVTIEKLSTFLQENTASSARFHI